MAWTAEEQFDSGPDERRTYVEAIEAKALALLIERWTAVDRVEQLLLAEFEALEHVGEAALLAALTDPARYRRAGARELVLITLRPLRSHIARSTSQGNCSSIAFSEGVPAGQRTRAGPTSSALVFVVSSAP